MIVEPNGRGSRQAVAWSSGHVQQTLVATTLGLPVRNHAAEASWPTEDGMAMGSPRRPPIRLTIVSDFELVVAGVEAMLSAHSDRLLARSVMAPISAR